MNLILRDSSQMPWHTDIKLIFDAFDGRQREFNWMITAHECYSESDLDIFNEEIVLLTGDELTDIVTIPTFDGDGIMGEKMFTLNTL